MTPRYSNDEISLLRGAFAKNQRFSDWFADSHKVPIELWRDYLNVLNDIHNLPIRGIQEKIAEIRSPTKLSSTLSELKAARTLAERDFKVELLLDNDCRFQSPPDLLAYRPDSKILVEVKSLVEEDDTEGLLRHKLQPLVEEKNIILNIEFYPEVISDSLFDLGLSFGDRDCKKNLFETFASYLFEYLKSLDKSQLPFDDVFANGLTFSVKSALPEKSIFPDIHFPWEAVPKEKYKERVLKKLYANKNGTQSKRENWQGKYLEYPFLIFLDLGRSSQVHRAVFSALYGSTNLVEPYEPNTQQVSYPESVMKGLQGEHRELLLKLGYDSRQCFHISKPGHFVTDESIRQNTTGVLTMLRGEVECFFNPFCDEKISLPDLSEYLDIPITSLMLDRLRQVT